MGSRIPLVLNFPDEQLGWQKVTECPTWGYSACFDKGDTLWVFSYDFPDLFYVLYVRYDGQSWSDVDTVSVLSSIDENTAPAVSADSSNGVWVGWSQHWAENVYNRYKDGQWDEPEEILGSYWSFEALSVTTDALGRVWFGWQDHGEGTSLECRYSDDGVWSEQMPIRGLDSVYAEKLDLAPDRDGGIWAVWATYRYIPGQGYDSTFVEARHYKDGVWDNIDTIANAGIFPGYEYSPTPKIAVDAYGRAWAVWQQALVEKDSCGDIYYLLQLRTRMERPKACG